MSTNRNFSSRDHKREPIAIIGIGCRFPGDANDPESFWELLCNGVDAITEVPRDRWNVKDFYHPTPGIPGKAYSKWGGFIKGIHDFEPECFGISPREASRMDPQQRLLLEVAWEALEDGGQVIEQIKGSKTGVFVGISTFDYANLRFSSLEARAIDAQTGTGTALSIAANRISYCLDLQGPSLATDTACSSALVATHLACQSIWNEESEMALAGGVNVLLLPGPFIAFCSASMLSPDGRCHTFDASANGFVRGEGAGMVVLKPLSKALADGDPVYALILGTAINQDGRTSGIAAPSPSAQEALLWEACRQAGIAPSEVQYIEAHGTGTPLGDPIEANAIGRVFSTGRPKDQHCIIGSVKTNIGHLEAGAGIAGVIKTALALKHHMIPPSLHFHTPNPHIPFEELQLRVPTSLEPWPDVKPAIAGVNSFGFGGTNAHVVMMEYQPAEETRTSVRRDDSSQLMLLPLSARTPEALQTLAQSYVDYLRKDSHSSIALRDICYTASFRRTHFDHRLSLVVQDKTELIEQLEAFLGGERRPGMTTNRRISGKIPKLAFVFSGQGPQWWGMGRELLEKEPVFRQMMEECDRLLRQHADWSLLTELAADEDNSRLNQTAIAQPAIFALQVSLAALWKSWGIEPEAVIGHSVGEIAAAHIAGVLSLEDAVRVIFHRGRCMDQASSKGRMLAVGLSMQEAEQAICGYEDRVSVAAINSPSSATLSGDPQALAEIAQALNTKGVFCRFLRVEYAFHSPQMDPVRDDLLASLNSLVPQPAVLPIFSTVLGKPAEGPEFDKHYWWENVRRGVLFAQGIDYLSEREFDLYLELSPHPVLSGSISECLMHWNRQGTALPSLRRQEDERVMMLGSLGALYTLGYPVNWQKLYPDGGRCVPLPRYPWQKQYHWYESEETRKMRLAGDKHPLLGERIQSADPTWEVVLDKRILSYLADHRVQGHAVFPAAGYVEMALAAARETLGVGPHILEEMQIQLALVLPESDEPPIVQLIYYPADGSFTIHSRTSRTDLYWTLHTSGYLRTQQGLRSSQQADLLTIRNRLDPVEPSAEYFHNNAVEGLHYGPLFQGVKQVWTKEGETLAWIQIPEALAQETEGYGFHPVLLDSCFQCVISAVSDDKYAEIILRDAVYLPVQINRVRVYQYPTEGLWCHYVVKNISTKVIEGDFHIYDGEGKLLMEIEGYRCQAVQGVSGDHNLEKWLYEVNWYNKPRPEQQLTRRAVDYIPTSAEITQFVTEEIQQLINELGWTADMLAQRMGPDLENLPAAYIVRAFRQLGWQGNPGDRVTVASLSEQLNIVPQHQRLMYRIMGVLERRGYFTRVDGNGWILQEVPPEQDPQQIWLSTFWRFPATFAELTLIHRCGLHLAEVLRGEIEPLQLIFPEGSTLTTEHFYQDSPTFRIYNTMIQKGIKYALQNLPQDRTLRILELGAGTGGLTTYVLPVLPENRTEYVFTDVSPLFLSKAEQKFHYPFVRYQVLDIEKDPLEQGFAPHSFDIVLASDVLHATTDLRDTLRNIQKVLASDGLLMFLESERQFSWVDLVFGLTEGWWRFSDFDLRPDYPLITRGKWREILEETKYKDVATLAESTNEQDSPQIVMIARGPYLQEEAQKTAQTTTELSRSNGEQGSWLLFADKSGIAQKLTQLLTEYGETCVVVTPGESFQHMEGENYQVSPDNPEDMERLLQTFAASHPVWRGTIHLWALDTPSPAEISSDVLRHGEVLGCHSVMHYIQALNKGDSLKDLPRLILVTRGAQPVGESVESLSIAQAPLLGLGRSIFIEHPEIRCKMVDLSLDPTPDEIRSLFAELWTEDPEEEIALRHEARFVPRVEQAKPKKIPVERKKIRKGEAPSFRLEVPTSGVIENLTLYETKRQQPGPGQVEIEVCAASLNFRDVMKVLGIYPTDAPDYMLVGDECAGRVVAVGEGVENVRVGDEVIAIAPGSFGSHVTTLATLVAPKPTSVTFEEAATMPVAFLTAHYALHHLARIRPGERVLIHAATGGVGLAALQIAQQVGAEVFATAGSPQKRELLHFLGVQHVMDSRSLSFADEIMERTGGQGVDIVLNSLAGKAIAKGISCLAPYGRFLELGKRDIYQNSKLGLWSFRKNISFFAIDLGGFFADKSTSTKSLLGELSQHIAETTWSPLPHRVFPVSRIREAFWYMAQAKHTGKIVISLQQNGAWIKPLDKEPVEFRPDVTYLITGGFGGIGLAVARWVIDHGGRYVVLMSRSGAASDEARQALEELQRTGAQVVEAKADVANEKQVAEVLASIEKTMPPLRGIFHAAMVLDDGLLLQLDRERFRKVMAPKVEGAWNLHVQTLHKPLDFFVLFSSVTSLVGNQGQGNYAAANAFFDAFAHYRSALGLPTMTINFGHVAEVGVVSRNQEFAELLTNRGVLGMSPAQIMEVLGYTLQQKPIQMGAMRMDWQKVANALFSKKLPQRVSSLISASSMEKGGEAGSLLRETLLHATQEEREELVQSYVRDQVARVLGASAAKLDVDRPLNELGLDSLMGFELKNRVESELGVTIPVRELLEKPTIKGLSRALLELLGMPVSAPATPSPAPKEAADQAGIVVDQLSDEEVDTFLQEMVDEELNETVQTEEERK